MESGVAVVAFVEPAFRTSGLQGPTRSSALTVGNVRGLTEWLGLGPIRAVLRLWGGVVLGGLRAQKSSEMLKISVP